MKKKIETVVMRSVLAILLVFPVIYLIGIRGRIRRKREGCLSRIWVIWNLVYIAWIILLLVWNFHLERFQEDRFWRMREIPIT